MSYHQGYAGSVHIGSAKLEPNNLKQAHKCPGSIQTLHSKYSAQWRSSKYISYSGSGIQIRCRLALENWKCVL